MSTPVDEKRHTPRPRRVPRTLAAQAKADAIAELFQPVRMVIDPDAANTPFDVRLNALFARNGWRPFPFQREVWKEILGGASGLLHATTGAGKTWAVWLGALVAYATRTRAARFPRRSRFCGSRRCAPSPPIAPVRCKPP